MSQDESRAYQRVGVRTSVTIVTRLPLIRTYRGWTDDLSPGGARILCEEDIREEELFLQVMLPGLKEHFFRGKVVRCDLSVVPAIRGGDRTLHAYGVQFIGICAPGEVEAWARPALCNA